MSVIYMRKISSKSINIAMNCSVKDNENHKL